MAQYGLETETTVHIKGMQFGDSQPDTGEGILNSNCLCINPTRYAVIYHAYSYQEGNFLYFRDYDTTFKDVVENTSWNFAFYEDNNSILNTIDSPKCFFITSDTKIPENAIIANKTGSHVFLYKNLQE